MGAPHTCLDDQLGEELALVPAPAPGEFDLDADHRLRSGHEGPSASRVRGRGAGPTVVEAWVIERPIAACAFPAPRRPRPWVPAALSAEWAVAVPPLVVRSSRSGGPARLHGVPSWQPAPSRRRARRARRRVLAGLALLGMVLFGVLALAGVGGEGPPPAADERAEPVASVAYVARPGDTLWSIAREIQPHGDVRPLVDALAALRHGDPLEPGDVVAWPPLPSGR